MPAAAVLSDELWTQWDESQARPRDFAARFRRNVRGAGKAPARMKRSWTLGVGALAAVALPAFAAPGEWDRFQIADAVAEQAPVEPMPFEQAGSSFPGSAFYYLDAEKPVLKVGEGVHSDADDAPSRIETHTPARPLHIDNSSVDRSRALQCMTAAIYYEAASESDAGQRAVAQVVLNRVAHPAYPGTVCGVVYQGSERATGCQFSFTCDGSLSRRPATLFWNRAKAIARQALAGAVYAPVGLATHYHTQQVHPYWASSLDYLGTIGEHRFYGFKGPAGRLAAFHFAYAGGEPAAAPRARIAASAPGPDAGLDPVTVQRTFTALRKASTSSGVNTSAPIIAANASEGGIAPAGAGNAGPKLPEAYGIKPEYANTGRWIRQPGR